jgi:hypothetical protein
MKVAPKKRHPRLQTEAVLIRMKPDEREFLDAAIDRLRYKMSAGEPVQARVDLGPFILKAALRLATEVLDAPLDLFMAQQRANSRVKVNSLAAPTPPRRERPAKGRAKADKQERLRYPPGSGTAER